MAITNEVTNILETVKSYNELLKERVIGIYIPNGNYKLIHLILDKEDDKVTVIHINSFFNFYIEIKNIDDKAGDFLFFSETSKYNNLKDFMKDQIAWSSWTLQYLFKLI